MDKNKSSTSLSIRQPNIISCAFYENSMTATAYKLIRYGYYLLSESIKYGVVGQDYSVSFTVSDFCKCLGISQGGNTSAQIKDALKELIEAKLYLEKSEGKYAYYNWTYTTTREDNDIIIKFNPDLIELALSNINQYSYLELKTLGKMKNFYGLRIYELLKSFYNTKGKRKGTKKNEWFTDFFDVPYLRKFFCAEDKYERECDFISRCIKSPIDNINKACQETLLNFKFSYETKKLGSKKLFRFKGEEVIQRVAVEFNNDDTPEEKMEKEESLTAELELELFKTKYADKWDELQKEAIKKSKSLLVKHPEAPELMRDIETYNYIKKYIEGDGELEEDDSQEEPDNGQLELF